MPHFFDCDIFESELIIKEFALTYIMSKQTGVRNRAESVYHSGALMITPYF